MLDICTSICPPDRASPHAVSLHFYGALPIRRIIRVVIHIACLFYAKDCNAKSLFIFSDNYLQTINRHIKKKKRPWLIVKEILIIHILETVTVIQKTAIVMDHAADSIIRDGIMISVFLYFIEIKLI